MRISLLLHGPRCTKLSHAIKSWTSCAVGGNGASALEGAESLKRDLELIRKLLFALEDKPGPEAVRTIEIDGYDESAIKHHLLLLAQANLIDFEPEQTKTGRIIRVLVFNPSWQGYEFLDSVRDNTVWQKVKDQISTFGTSVPFDIVRSLATEAVKRSMDF